MTDWRAKVHEIDFTAEEREKLKQLYIAEDADVEEMLESLVVDNAKVKVGSSEYYSSYTFSYTFDKNHPTYPGHSFWFYDVDLCRGVWALKFYIQSWLPDKKLNGVAANPKSLF